MNERAPTSIFSPGIRWFWLVWTMLVLSCAGWEIRRYLAADNVRQDVTWWLFNWGMETTLPLLVLLILPLIIWIDGQARRSLHRTRPSVDPHGHSAECPPEPRVLLTIAGSVVLFVVSLFCSWSIGDRPVDIQVGFRNERTTFGELPPAYHDEYSYLMQARTFSAGRLSYPGMSIRPDLFHQFHVLNEHRTVSRYFPWTSCWMMPFVMNNHPYWGHWFAGALAAVLFFLSVVQVFRFRAAFFGGMLVALSPGIAIFSNLLLAHHPTMLALSVFSCCFVRMMKTQQLRWACGAGVGLSLAMLGRPMTAAGFALPFGIWLLWQIVRHPGQRKLTIGFATPLMMAFAMLAVCNHDATGSWTRTAYQEYTDRYTPKHRYGFGNGTELAEVDAAPAINAYNNWASNLTLAKALQNVQHRLAASFQWSLAVVPLVLGLLMLLPQLRPQNAQAPEHATDAERRQLLKLLILSVVSLHLVHVPYWYDGIMHWHYIFETAPLLLVLSGIGLASTVQTLSAIMRRSVVVGWMALLLAVSIVPKWISLPVYAAETSAENPGNVPDMIDQLLFARRRFEIFRLTTHDKSVQQPSLILVDERGTDPQLSYIVNSPNLDSDVITCRLPATQPEIAELQAAFPERHFYVFHPRTMQLHALNASQDSARP